VLVLVPWFETQNGLVGLREMPQGLIRSGSVIVANPGMLDTRLVCRKAASAGSARPMVAAARAASRATRAQRIVGDRDVSLMSDLLEVEQAPNCRR